ncbi:hypothetical protein GALMADRAFT_1051637 [Galerina marginata CBS 339.88]|uniref:Uncharacterized protein n=1 Tax=Galerina marginata (strain CBS 339.88) TaxID=685588 RepID=A0A067SK59_GALM3|nr:hypothetical protein GALMADRAFT_1051637 [Galerina marginata CBS 339.88]
MSWSSTHFPLGLIVWPSPRYPLISFPGVVAVIVPVRAIPSFVNISSEPGFRYEGKRAVSELDSYDLIDCTKTRRHISRLLKPTLLHPS